MAMQKILIHGEIGWDVTSQNICDALDNANGKDLDVHVASPGGFVFDGIEIFNAFRDYKKQYPKAQMMLTIKGLAASMASYLAVCPAFDMICAEDNAVFMIHNAYGGASGDYRDMLKAAEVFEGITGIIASAYIKKTGKSEKDIRKMMDEESWFFGTELKDAGFVDEIISTSEKSDRLAAVANAKLRFQNVSAKLKDKHDDPYRLAAMLGKTSKTGGDSQSQHEAHVRPVDDFEEDNFYTMDNTDEGHKYLAPGVKIVIGKLKEPEDDCKMKSHKVTFDSDKFTEKQAQDYCAQNDIKYISFHPAQQDGDGTVDIKKTEPFKGSAAWYKEQIKNSTNPAKRDNIIGGKPMSLKDLLASDPAAKFEYDESLRAADKAGYDRCIKDSELRIAKASLVLNATDKAYPKAVKDVALEVMSGKKSVETLETMVSQMDMFAEMLKSQAAGTEQPPATPGELDPTTLQSELAKEDEEVARAKKMMGRK